MKNWLRLIRWKNLLIVFFTQLVVWYCLIYDSGNFWRFGAIADFLPLAGSTVLIAAAGYIINDYFDIKIDIINRPGKVVLEKKIPLKAAILAHVILNIAGLALAASVALGAHHLEWVMLQVICIALLWFYSTHFKRQFITGNIVVAILTALAVIVLAVYEPAMNEVHMKRNILSIHLQPIKPDWILYCYAFFAFMLTWMREIVKDMEDFIGDAEQGCVTMPIKMGLQFSAIFAQVLGGITLASLVVITGYLVQHANLILAAYTVAFIVAPLAWWCYFVSRTHTTAHYHVASRWLKIIMISGICSLIVYHFTNNY